MALPNQNDQIVLIECFFKIVWNSNQMYFEYLAAPTSYLYNVPHLSHIGDTDLTILTKFDL